MENKKITIQSEFITLGQMLKFARIIDSGAEAKAYLATNEVKVNGEIDNRRGRKLRPGDEVMLPGITVEING